YIKYI
ncbi:hypothetical protein ECMA6_5709, partial [Escherichia coli MA6]